MANFERRKRRVNERLLLGVIIIVAGILILLRNLNLMFVPGYLFTWPMILIAIGLIIGIKDGFRNNGWWIMMIIGGYFLMTQNNPDWQFRQFFWPVILIAVGLSFLLGRRKRRWIEDDTQTQATYTTNAQSTTQNTYTTNAQTTMSSQGTNSSDNVIDATAVFGAVKKNIYAKDLRGGDISAIFGGAEINLMNADFDREARLDVTCMFGGCTLVVPSHWQIRSDATAVFGGIDDKRPHTSGVSADKVLILDGFVMFGGIDIKSAY